MGILGGLAGGVGSALVGGLFGGGGSSSGSGTGTQTVIQEPWPGVQPYLTGESGYVPQVGGPISSDWLYWNYMAGQGMPVGPPPPMFVNSPQYTGENVYDPPFQYQPIRSTGPAYGDQGPYGAPTPDTGGLLSQGPPQYPSSSGTGTVPAPAPAESPGKDPEQKEEGLSDLDKWILRQHQRTQDAQWASDPEAGLLGGAYHPGSPVINDLSESGQAYVRSKSADEWGQEYRSIVF